MSDRKTAAELREMSKGFHYPSVWRELWLHLAAVEEEREAAERCEHLAEAKRELETMTRSRDDWKARYDSLDAQAARKMDELRERAERAERQARSFEASLFDTAKTLHATVDLVTEERRIAADALRIGLEECERLRAELERWIDAAVKLQDELDALKGEREKTREYWELWCGTEHVATYPANDASDAESVRREVYGDKGPGDRVVHVTRWRKR